MVAKAEEGIKMTDQETRLTNIMMKTKSNLVRNMAAEFITTKGTGVQNDKDNLERANKIKHQAERHRQRARKITKMLSVSFEVFYWLFQKFGNFHKTSVNC